MNTEPMLTTLLSTRIATTPFLDDIMDETKGPQVSMTVDTTTTDENIEPVGLEGSADDRNMIDYEPLAALGPLPDDDQDEQIDDASQVDPVEPLDLGDVEMGDEILVTVEDSVAANEPDFEEMEFSEDEILEGVQENITEPTQAETVEKSDTEPILDLIAEPLPEPQANDVGEILESAGTRQDNFELAAEGYEENVQLYQESEDVTEEAYETGEAADAEAPDTEEQSEEALEAEIWRLEQELEQEERRQSIHSADESEVSLDDIQEDHGLESSVPITLQTNDTEYQLMPHSSRGDSSHLPILMEDASACRLSLEGLFVALREVFRVNGSAFKVDEELVLEFHELNLFVNEDHVYARDLTLNDIVYIFQGLKQNSHKNGQECPSSLTLILHSQARFITGFNALTELVGQGKGFADMGTFPGDNEARQVEVAVVTIEDPKMDPFEDELDGAALKDGVNKDEEEATVAEGQFEGASAVKGSKPAPEDTSRANLSDETHIIQTVTEHVLAGSVANISENSQLETKKRSIPDQAGDDTENGSENATKKTKRDE
ncbi:hypothetical protein BABINDRAFT_10828 [Babjeviella inositovora NRRL Y-12698]|uniref:Uncharacterized protein n=1 Tax=Babjeviella inositovora NRRL Y-12698 TaxID=984486 RepID=A0A1E3QZ70_9ASCO|nr:uncharacterized protein BABINDRAFT_10828 [Babjeviella inositovora NRRL Y-12698]ODQ82382.1 hypothetical protein BABINDRAFT_10828 [Babjeviella inositovora NRRL Y-12698]